jgi:hypothetical protein
MRFSSIFRLRTDATFLDEDNAALIFSPLTFRSLKTLLGPMPSAASMSAAT